MSSSIPYDPSLAIGNIIPREKLEKIKTIASAQADADSKEQYLESLIRLKRSLDIHIQEMISMGADIKELNEEVATIKKEIEKASIEFSKAKISSETEILNIKKDMPIVNESVESPIDFSKSVSITKPLSVNSMQMSSKYFSYINVDNDKKNNGENQFISEVVSFMKENSSIENKTIENQAHSQLKNSVHENIGTLVICINCTHQMASIYDSIVLDPNKAVNTWNSYFKDDKIDIDNPQMNLSDDKEKSMEIISGATYGSSFIALIHISSKHQINRILDIEGVLKNLSMSVHQDILNKLKELGVFDQTVQMNCNIITNGIVPNFKSSENQTKIKTVFDTNTMIDVLDDYINKINSSDKTFGVPLNYYTKQITKKDILKLLKKEENIQDNKGDEE